jgi:hypothetical protein
MWCCCHRAAPALAATLALAVGPFCVQGQTAPKIDATTVDDLRPPLSPAFVLLGIEPASVQQPETPRALSSALLSLASDEGALPRNFALEVAPYWLQSRPRFRFEDFYSPQFRTTVARSLSFSIGTSPRLVSNDTVGTSVGVGARALLAAGRASSTLTSIKDRLQTRLGQCAAAADVEVCYDSLHAMLDTLKANQRPVGFVVQMATGASADFENDVAQRGRWRRFGVWLTPSYRWEGHVDAIFVARYLRQRVAADEVGNANLVDLGARLLWRPANPLALSAEALSRLGTGGTTDAQDTRRYGGLVEYRATSDLYVFYSFGRDFAAADAPRSNLISTLGINVGLGQRPVVALKP